MSQFIHLLKDRTSAGSVILYCSVIAIAIVAAFLSQYSLLNKSDLKKKNEEKGDRELHQKGVFSGPLFYNANLSIYGKEK